MFGRDDRAPVAAVEAQFTIVEFGENFRRLVLSASAVRSNPNRVGRFLVNDGRDFAWSFAAEFRFRLLIRVGMRLRFSKPPPLFKSQTSKSFWISDFQYEVARGTAAL